MQHAETAPGLLAALIFSLLHCRAPTFTVVPLPVDAGVYACCISACCKRLVTFITGANAWAHSSARGAARAHPNTMSNTCIGAPA